MSEFVKKLNLQHSRRSRLSPDKRTIVPYPRAVHVSRKEYYISDFYDAPTEDITRRTNDTEPMEQDGDGGEEGANDVSSVTLNH